MNRFVLLAVFATIMISTAWAETYLHVPADEDYKGESSSSDFNTPEDNNGDDRNARGYDTGNAPYITPDDPDRDSRQAYNVPDNGDYSDRYARQSNNELEENTEDRDARQDYYLY
ncbi:unnamed protein product [Orchesella dallaii]|uniref:Secreted protein n=1 Tax=Orchesella dallaii TaxID=48710 RepID=A0ABP1Q7P8_9HEXA